MIRPVLTLLAVLSTSNGGSSSSTASSVENQLAGASSAGPTTSAPTTAPCTPLLFGQRQYVLETTESYVGVLMVLIPTPNSNVIGYNVRTPGYDSSLIINNVTGIVQKAVKMNHQRVEILVQAETAGSERRNITNSTDVVEADETLIIVNIMDENDSAPQLDCSVYGDSCDQLVVGFPATDTAALPAPLLRLTSSDADTGLFGVAGIRYSVNSSAFSVDQNGLLCLTDSIDDQQTVQILAEDNAGMQPSLQAEAILTVVPVTDRQLFFVSTSRHLADTSDVTALLEDIRSAGDFITVLSAQLQAFNYGERQGMEAESTVKGAASRLYVYAIERDDNGDYQAVDAEPFRRALEKMSTPDTVSYIQTKDDQMHHDADSQSTVTGLIVALAVVSCLLAAVAAIAVVRERSLRRRQDGS